jgi:seryl-tRNA synthetase
MSDDATNDLADGQEPDVSDDQSPADSDGSPGGAVDAQSPSPEEIRKLRSEAASLRKRAKAAEDELRKRDDAALSDAQRLEREKSGLEAKVSQLESRLRDANVQAIAAKVGVKADLVDTVSALIDWDDVDTDDAKAIEKAVKELVKERPSLSSKPEGMDGGAGRGGGQGSGRETTLTDLLVDATRRR